MAKLKGLLITIGLLLMSDMVRSAIVPEGTVLRNNQEIVINNGGEPASLDPHKVQGILEAVIIRQLFEGLVERDANGNIIPALAVEWHSEDHNKKWFITLRQDAKWSDGSLVTAHDIVYSWQRLADPKTASPYASYLDKLKVANINEIIQGKKPPAALGIKALDDFHLVLTLSSPVPYAPAMWVSHSLVPVSKKVIEKFGDNWVKVGHFVSNGAYQLSERVLNEKLVFTRNPYYWNDKQTIINKATLLSLNSESTAFARYRANEIDVSESFPLESWSKLKSELADDIKVTRTIGTYFYVFNTQKAPFNQRDIRKALSLAFDRQIITDKVLLGMGQTPTYTFTPTYIKDGNEIQDPDYAKLSQVEKNQLAIQYLEKAGFTAKQPLTFSLLYNTSDSHKKIAVAMASMWKKNTGGRVNVVLQNQEWKTFLNKLNSGEFDVARSGWQAEYNNPTALQNNFLSNSANNDAKFYSEEFDKLIAQSYWAETDEERAKIYAQAEKVLVDSFAIMPIYNNVHIRLVKPYVKGFYTTDPQDYYYIKNLYLVQ